MFTEDVLRGDCIEEHFDRCITFIVGGLMLGTILDRILLVPGAKTIGFIARLL